MKSKANLMEELQLQGLISFEEITDYNIIQDTLSKKSKRKLDKLEQQDEKSSKKAKLDKKEKKEKKAKKEKKKPTAESKDGKRTKLVHFEKKVTILNPDGEDTPKAKKQAASAGAVAKPGIIKSAEPKTGSNKRPRKKLQTPNSTSRMSIHDENQSEFDDDVEVEQKMKAWSDLMLPMSLLRALCEKGFYEPTPIQKAVLPEAIKTRSNIIGTAQTGSGKTLAFGLPILTRLIDSYVANQVVPEEGQEATPKLSKKKTVSLNDTPQALILTPTRELAVQIKDHLQGACKYHKIKIAVVVGGLSQIKQERLLSKCPEIVVATPGRLMQLIDEGNDYLSKISKIKYFVIDEADRMIEKGHYGEMEKILALLNSDEKLKAKRQNFLFSATLITEFNHQDGKEKQSDKPKTPEQLKKEQKALLRALVNKIQMVKEPVVFDLTTKAVTADNLFESKIFCPVTDKDIYLYYFSCKYSGRTLVFANSIDCVRRLTNLFRLLKKNPLHLHANMNQKMRLKNLEKFNASQNSLLIASDVAARGLDIPGVMHVIHYQVPRSAEIYVHRSGRTARTKNEGLSVMLVAPDEINLYRKILKTFKKETADLATYPVDMDYFDECKKRVVLARKIDETEHQMNKEKNTSNWYEKQAKMLDIELDDEIVKETSQDQEQTKKKRRELTQLKARLESQLKTIIFPKNCSRSYLHSDSYNRIKSVNETNLSALDAVRGKKKASA